MRVRPLQRAVDDWLADRSGKVAPATVDAGRSALGHLLAWCGDELRTDCILIRHERARLDGYAYLQDLVDERLREGYKVSTVTNWLAHWCTFFGWLGSSIKISTLTLPAAPKNDVRPWTDEEIEAIRRAADHVDRHDREEQWPAARRVVEFFLASGARQQEGFAAEWPRFREADATIRFVAQLGRDRRRLLVPLKGKRARTTLLLPFWWPHHHTSTGYVLGRPDGLALTRRPQCDLLDRVLEQARLTEDGVGYHRFRHTYARLFIEAGGRLEELQKSLGHGSIRTTEAEYGHFHEDVAARLAKQRIYDAAPTLQIVSTG